MTNSEIIDRVMKRLGNRTNIDLRTHCTIEVETKIREYEQGPVLPWFLETEASLTTAANSPVVALPSNFLREVEDGSLWILVESRQIPLPKHSLEAVRTNEVGCPRHYALHGSNIHLGPVPDKEYLLTLAYYRSSPTFSDTSEPSVDWCRHASNLVIFGAAAQVAATYIQNQELAIILGQLETRAMQTLVMDTEARMATNQDFNIQD